MSWDHCTVVIDDKQCGQEECATVHMTAEGHDFESCVFCAIVNEQAPAKVFMRSADYVVFEPLNPHTLGHLLVVPVKHVKSAVDDPEVYAQMSGVAAWVARAHTDACNILTSVGKAATQTIEHLHIHVVPRDSDNDDVPADWPWMRDGH
jgi:histidine triad (HIT) family protein